MEQRLKDKIAIVTGAGRGIGRGVALRLAREGAHVVIAEYDPDTAQQTAHEVQALGVSAMPYRIDLSDVSQIRPMVDAVVRAFGLACEMVDWVCRADAE